MKIPLLITLKDDLVISSRSATAGEHTSLDYIPGSMLLGVVASRLYKALSTPAEQWQVFHSANVRFLNGYGVHHDGYPSYPSPLNLHYYKNDILPTNGRLFPSLMRPNIDVEFNTIDTSKQPKQLRDAFITEHGHLVQVKKSASLKTAIDDTTGRAAQSQLFGYQAIQAGQRFLAFIEYNDHIDPTLINKLLNAIEGPARMGRSRSAQYGRVDITRLDQAPTHSTQPLNVGDTSVTLWCLSDLALTCPITGQPTLTPQPQHFGLSSGQLNIRKSFLRSRSYSPFNAHRQAFDSERQVISQGSVITFSQLDPLSQEQIHQLNKPVGLFTETGNGQVLAQASTCVGDLPKSAKTITSDQKPKRGKKHSRKQSKTKPKSLLIRWLNQQPKTNSIDHSEWVNSTLKLIEKYFLVARSFNGLPSGLAVGPSPSQWGAVQEYAKNHTETPVKLFQSLFCDTDALCRVRMNNDHAWGLKAMHNMEFNRWLANHLLTTNPRLEIEARQDLVTLSKSLHNPVNKDALNALNDKIIQLTAAMRTERGQQLSLSAAQEEQ